MMKVTHKEKEDKFKIREELSKNKYRSAERSAQIDSFLYVKEFIKWKKGSHEEIKEKKIRRNTFKMGRMKDQSREREWRSSSKKRKKVTVKKEAGKEVSKSESQ